MFRSFVKSILVILLSIVVISQSSAAGEKLRYQMAKGGRYKYTLSSDTKTKVQAMGQEFSTTAASMFGISITVEEVGKDGEMTCVARVDTNLSRIESPMMKDSALVFKEINGKRSRLILSALGKTLKATPIDTVQPTQAMAMMGGLNVTDILRRLFLTLPEQAVGVGESWKQTHPETLSVQGINLITKPDVLFKIEVTETVNGHDCVKISFAGTASQYGTGSRQGMEMVLDGKVKSKGTAYFAPREGILVSIESSSDSEMTGSGTGEQMFTFTQSTTQKSKMTLVK